MRGKEKCRILREIRRRIAEENDIELITEDCAFQGECRGTCPKCESEVRYLERELARRQAACKRVAVAGLAAALMLPMSGCAAVKVIESLNPFGSEKMETLTGEVEMVEETGMVDESGIEEEPTGDVDDVELGDVS